MRNALILANVVQNVITSACPNPQDYQAVVDVSAVYCEPGWTWNGGTSFTKVVPVEVTNQKTIEQQADDALAALTAAIDQTNTWRTSGAGAGTANLTSAQLSTAMRQSADNDLTTMRAVRGLIRLARNKFDSAS